MIAGRNLRHHRHHPSPNQLVPILRVQTQRLRVQTRKLKTQAQALQKALLAQTKSTHGN